MPSKATYIGKLVRLTLLIYQKYNNLHIIAPNSYKLPNRLVVVDGQCLAIWFCKELKGKYKDDDRAFNEAGGSSIATINLSDIISFLDKFCPTPSSHFSNDDKIKLVHYIDKSQ